MGSYLSSLGQRAAVTLNGIVNLLYGGILSVLLVLLINLESSGILYFKSRYMTSILDLCTFAKNMSPFMDPNAIHDKLTIANNVNLKFCFKNPQLQGGSNRGV